MVELQGVQWIVMTEPSSLSVTQLEEYRASVAAHDGSKVRYHIGSSGVASLQEISEKNTALVPAQSKSYSPHR